MDYVYNSKNTYICVFHYGVVCISLWSGVYFTMEWCIFYYGVVCILLWYLSNKRQYRAVCFSLST